MDKKLSVGNYLLDNSSFCTGCAACANTCPFNAITMKEDDEGFLYPSVELGLCTQCGVCIKKCPAINLRKYQDKKLPSTYAYISLNERFRIQSSSGGCFTDLAQEVLKQNGIIYGACFNDRWEVVHQSAESVFELDNLRMSKYVQSKIGNTYQNVLRDLKKGRLVMFVGTPCQCEGLKRVLPENSHNLLLVDFICHGVPSPLVWRKYLSEVSQNDINKIKNISFRDKHFSWERYCLTIEKGDNPSSLFKEYEDVSQNLYLRGFLANLYLRPSCYQCKFCRYDRASDITMADYWGVGVLEPTMYDGKGTSLVFLNTKKGSTFFSNLNGKKLKTDFNAAVKHNPSFYRPSPCNPKRTAFFNELKNDKNVVNLLEIYLRPPLKIRIKDKVGKILGLKSLYHLLKRK
ncbi:MAG: Coenzyme F420 hydrogenase/dehydrogenase, beta subunit C-terminal domain [Acidaminococcus sp.]|jgi:coenzyme F420-reducing hydrogenase beta subunit|nr:Coenzyme F420 hydrogenase/dehydrogenase, beta subunit C-terminal domain [Acidaminococcus sp.]MCI2116462.1 Coenzyme F420 hydrogenase/dehydrogenase, beta subunit C-terminal domain [Acidaminococcus sp.]